MSAKVVTVFNQKGGCGKTTLSMTLAGSMGLMGLRALVVDMDTQGTAVRWAASAPDENPFPAAVISLAPMEGRMHREIKNHLDAYDVIFIDCPPALNSPVPTSAMLISDLALIPIVPSPADVWAAEAAKQLAKTASITNETLVVRVAPNMVQRQTALAKDLLEVLMEDEEVPVLKNHFGSRSAFRECQVMGTTVHKVPRAQTSIDEAQNLTLEVLDLLKIKVK